MRHIVEQLVEMSKSLGMAFVSNCFYIEDSRLQRNVARVMADPAMTAAALAGVIGDHRVVEALVKTNVVARTVIMQVETKLGRKLSRDRAKKLLLAYERVSRAKVRPSTVVQLPKPERYRLAA